MYPDAQVGARRRPATPGSWLAGGSLRGCPGAPRSCLCRARTADPSSGNFQCSSSGLAPTPAPPFPGSSSSQAALSPPPLQKAPEEPSPREARPLLLPSWASLRALGARRPLLPLFPLDAGAAHPLPAATHLQSGAAQPPPQTSADK